jgi:hypothetical protein
MAKSTLKSAGITLLAVALAASLAAMPGLQPGNGPAGQQGPGNGQGTGQSQTPAPPPGQQQTPAAQPSAGRVETTIEGTVVGVFLDSPDFEYPVIEVDVSGDANALVKLGPAWYLLEQDFELQIGDAVSLVVVPCQSSTGVDYVALSITVDGDLLELRSSSGSPAWAGNRHDKLQPGRRCQGAGACIDTLSISSVEGTIARLIPQQGLRFARLMIRPDGGGDPITVGLGPTWHLQAADCELHTGDRIQLRIAETLRTRDRVALELQNSLGQRVRFRNESGSPEW